MIKEVEQKVKHYYKGNKIAILESYRGKVYPCTVSDRVRLTMNMKPGDTAIVRIINKRWVIYDVKPKMSVEDQVPQDDFNMAENMMEY